MPEDNANTAPKPASSFTGAVLKYFGKKPNQSMVEFKDELAKLTAQDRIDLTPGLEAALGVTITA